MMKQGFTLIEILISLAISAILIGAGLWISFDSYKKNLFKNEIDIFTALLERARSEAINNENGQPHGLFIEKDSYVIFSGSVYRPGDPSNERNPRNSVIKESGASEAIFQNLSADNVTDESFTFSDGIQTRTVRVSSNGRIDY